MDQYKTMSEKELALKVFEGEPDAIAELYQRYRTRLFAIALGDLRDDQLAADVVQDVFFHILENGLKSFDVNRSLLAYLTACVRNKVLDHYKISHRRDKYYEQYNRTMYQDDPKQEEPLRVEDINRAVDEQLARLPKELRDVLTLSLKHEMDAREIAGILNKNLSNVHTQLRDSKRKFRPAVLRWLKFNVWYWSVIFAAEAECAKKINFFFERNTYMVAERRNEGGNIRVPESNRLLHESSNQRKKDDK